MTILLPPMIKLDLLASIYFSSPLLIYSLLNLQIRGFEIKEKKTLVFTLLNVRQEKTEETCSKMSAQSVNILPRYVLTLGFYIEL